MKYYKGCYPDRNGKHTEVYMSEDDIIDEYFHYWSMVMIKEDKYEMVSVKNCIDDWVVVHWAQEISSDEYWSNKQ